MERRTQGKSYNYYYQGLSYTALGNAAKAKEYFAYAATRFSDQYAARSTFEMAAIEYNSRNKAQSVYWLSLYNQRYPRGVYRAIATQMQGSLTTGKWLPKIEGIKKPDMERALYRYNKLSLHPEAHYWFLQGGWQYIDRSGFEPTIKGGLNPRTVSQIALMGNAGVGIGPWRQDNMSAFGGYTYRQLWLTDNDRLATYFAEPSDLSYFPFRADLLERRHQFYGDFRREFLGRFFWGGFGRYELARIGSKYFPSPEDSELQQVLKISDTSLVIPWVGVSYANNMRTLVYFYLRKEINEDSPEHSNKTYALGTDGEDPVLSLGLSHAVEIPELKIGINAELYRYEFIYNDYWLDYKRIGGLLSINHELITNWHISALGGYYVDEYILPRIKLRPCASQVTPADATTTFDGVAPRECPRTDSGILVQAGLYWNWTQFQRFSADVQFVSNRNADQKEFDESKMTIQFAYSLAFPSVQRVTRLVDRFADSAFTKEAQ